VERATICSRSEQWRTGFHSSSSYRDPHALGLARTDVRDLRLKSSKKEKPSPIVSSSPLPPDSRLPARPALPPRPRRPPHLPPTRFVRPTLALARDALVKELRFRRQCRLLPECGRNTPRASRRRRRRRRGRRDFEISSSSILSLSLSLSALVERDATRRDEARRDVSFGFIVYTHRRPRTCTRTGTRHWGARRVAERGNERAFVAVRATAHGETDGVWYGARTPHTRTHAYTVARRGGNTHTHTPSADRAPRRDAHCRRVGGISAIEPRG